MDCHLVARLLKDSHEFVIAVAFLFCVCMKRLDNTCQQASAFGGGPSHVLPDKVAQVFRLTLEMQRPCPVDDELCRIIVNACNFYGRQSLGFFLD